MALNNPNDVSTRKLELVNPGRTEVTDKKNVMHAITDIQPYSQTDIVRYMNSMSSFAKKVVAELRTQPSIKGEQVISALQPKILDVVKHLFKLIPVPRTALNVVTPGSAGIKTAAVYTPTGIFPAVTDPDAKDPAHPTDVEKNWGRRELFEQVRAMGTHAPEAGMMWVQNEKGDFELWLFTRDTLVKDVNQDVNGNLNPNPQNVYPSVDAAHTAGAIGAFVNTHQTIAAGISTKSDIDTKIAAAMTALVTNLKGTNDTTAGTDKVIAELVKWLADQLTKNQLVIKDARITGSLLVDQTASATLPAMGKVKFGTQTLNDVLKSIFKGERYSYSLNDAEVVGFDTTTGIYNTIVTKTSGVQSQSATKPFVKLRTPATIPFNDITDVELYIDGMSYTKEQLILMKDATTEAKIGEDVAYVGIKSVMLDKSYMKDSGGPSWRTDIILTIKSVDFSSVPSSAKLAIVNTLVHDETDKAASVHAINAALKLLKPVTSMADGINTNPKTATVETIRNYVTKAIADYYNGIIGTNIKDQTEDDQLATIKMIRDYVDGWITGKMVANLGKVPTGQAVKDYVEGLIGTDMTDDAKLATVAAIKKICPWQCNRGWDCSSY